MKRLMLLCVFVMALLVAGCAQVTSEIKVDSDFGGSWQATIQAPAPISKDDILSAVADKKEGTQSIDVIKIKLVPVDATGKEISGDTPGMRSQSWKLKTKFANKDELASISKIAFGRSNGDKAINVIYPYGDDPDVYMFNLGQASGTTTITVPGTIIKESVGKGMVKSDDTIVFAQGTPIKFQFKKSGSWGIIIGGVLAIVVVAGGFVWYRRRQAAA